MSKVIVYDPIVILGELGDRKLLCLAGAGQARLSPKIAEFVTQGLRNQELKKLTGEDHGIYENHSKNRPQA
jgi:hypothetical protein